MMDIYHWGGFQSGSSYTNQIPSENIWFILERYRKEKEQEPAPSELPVFNEEEQNYFGSLSFFMFPDIDEPDQLDPDDYAF
jgi:hypothetical protein